MWQQRPHFSKMHQTICNLTGIWLATWLFWLFFWSIHWYSGLCMSYYSYVRNEREPETKPISLSFIASLYFHPSLSLRGGTSWSLDGKIKQATPSFIFPSALGVCVCVKLSLTASYPFICQNITEPFSSCLFCCQLYWSVQQKSQWARKERKEGWYDMGWGKSKVATSERGRRRERKGNLFLNFFVIPSFF